MIGPRLAVTNDDVVVDVVVIVVVDACAGGPAVDFVMLSSVMPSKASPSSSNANSLEFSVSIA